MTQREIKFRAWDKKDSMFLEEGYVHNELFNLLEEGEENVVVMQYTGLKDSKGVPIYEGDVVKVVDGGEAVGMGSFAVVSGMGNFAIVSGVEGTIGEVMFHQDGWVIYPHRDNEHESHYSLAAYGKSAYGEFLKQGEQSDTLEVIGNIYSNPELL